jgi:putative heme-binding domain-containing protein
MEMALKGARLWHRLLVVALAAAGGNSTAALLAAQQGAVPVDVQDGQRLYLGACANCHGPDGDAVPGVDLGRGQFRRASSDSELIEIVRRGIPGTAMPPGNYSNTQATQIVAYLRALAGSGERTTAAGDAGRGEALFAGKGGCLTCHEVHGRGSRLGPDLSDVGRLRRASELERALVDPPGEVRPQNRGVRLVTREGATVTGRLLHHDTFTVLMLDAKERLRSFAKADLRDVAVIKTSSKASYRGKLSDAEIADLVGYLMSLKGTKTATP